MSSVYLFFQVSGMPLNSLVVQGFVTRCSGVNSKNRSFPLQNAFYFYTWTWDESVFSRHAYMRVAVSEIIPWRRIAERKKQRAAPLGRRNAWKIVKSECGRTQQRHLKIDYERLVTRLFIICCCLFPSVSSHKNIIFYQIKEIEILSRGDFVYFSSQKTWKYSKKLTFQ